MYGLPNFSLANLNNSVACSRLSVRLSHRSLRKDYDTHLSPGNTPPGFYEPSGIRADQCFYPYTAATETGATQTMKTNHRAELKQKIPNVGYRTMKSQLVC